MLRTIAEPLGEVCSVTRRLLRKGLGLQTSRRVNAFFPAKGRILFEQPRIFALYFIKGAILEKKIIRCKMCVLILSTCFVSNFFVNCVVLYVLFVCKCVLYYCHRVVTQLQLTNVSYHIMSYHISYRIVSYRIISYIIYIVSYHIYHISYHVIMYHILSYII